MKRVALLAVAALFVLSTVCTASAVELNVRGGLDVHGDWLVNGDHNSDESDGDNFTARQRLRTWFDFVANENLKAVVGIESNTYWGEYGKGDFGSDGDSLVVKHAYLDFTEPTAGINVKAGLQTIAFPGIFGNPILDDDAAGLLVSKQINDMFAITAGWVRGYDLDTPYNEGKDKLEGDDVDVALLVLPVTADGFSVIPYFAYGWIGQGATEALIARNDTPEGLVSSNPKRPLTDDLSAIWLGANFSVDMFDPIVVAGDLMYGNVDGDCGQNDRAGYVFDLAVDYKMDMMTPELFFIYGTGEDDDATDGSELMPFIDDANWGASVGVGYGSMFWNSADGVAVGAPVGIWAIGGALKDITFVEKLSNTLKVIYAQGTNDEDLYKTGGAPDLGSSMGLSENDSFIEVDLITKYQIFEELVAALELGYINPDLDDNDHGGNVESDAIWKIATGFQYRF
jgi:hypothetical protein